ncbi:hypothetical protein [Sinosporangium siamense]
MSPLIRIAGSMVLVALGVTACQQAEPVSSGAAGAPVPAVASPAGEAPAPAAGEAPAPAAPVTRKVTLEVIGKGKSVQPIAFVADVAGTEADAELPWKKTVTVELTKAEQKVGRLINIIPGSVRDAKGKIKLGKCRILVEGKVVATNDSGQVLCEHMLK